MFQGLPDAGAGKGLNLSWEISFPTGWKKRSPAELGVLDSEAWGAKVPELFAEGILCRFTTGG